MALMRIWSILGARVRLSSTKNRQGIGGLSRVKVPGVNGLNINNIINNSLLIHY